MDKQETRTILRRFRDERREVIALFPDLAEGRGRCESYMHIGQHSAADRGLTRDTLPVDPAEPDAVALLAELKRIGYRVRLIKRMPRER